ncbi:2-succinyl-6-hydroxy-2,4-cyclohexadiene-1-carboxylate synthase [Metabacillus halosaccharovorans]|uniref:Putative 2-succinyl-6-hydroxy-2,4-cyclohexadiene-1-carboxylate synthase n=1 Tax=Metabacillus halosaccharovorans TaxID=930124 RepID=A0ABT3DPI8_9BACI|nr:2-succinyl-6-hydroxy-2,4-cyclohexadiene-1-carboxylate synthase [Metabacillus halosaccharovorans]MCV9888986.1 2-succinyl-6-hydroxy-2,4-cyclohexadiene-1-carboxylate synthase [Metabacillus halosaccharovorans]
MKIRDVSYHVEIEGKGEPLVFLHGFTGSSLSWQHLINDFRNYQLIFIDILGHGKSDHPSDSSRYKMGEVVEDIIEIFNRLTIDKAHIVGYSMGGRLALSLAALYPHRVKKLVLESSSPGLNTDEERNHRIKSDQALADEIVRGGISRFVDKWEKIPLFSSQMMMSDSQKNKLREQRLLNTEIGLANSLLGMGTGSQPSWWDKLPNLHISVLLLCGELDQKFCEIAKRMHERLPFSVIKEINQAGHAIHVEQPRIFGKIVIEFLNEDKSLN